jgi:hypothetical protein
MRSRDVRHSRSAARDRKRLGPLLAAVFVAVFLANPTYAGAISRDEGVCASEFEAATSAIGSARLPDGHPAWVMRAATRAMTLFRLHRPDEGLLKLDSAVKSRPGPWSSDVPAGRQAYERTVAAVDSFRTCIAAAQPPAMATLTIRTHEYDETAPRGRGRRASGVADIDVDGLRVGQTRADGSATLRVPSGRIRVEVTLYPSSWAEADLTLAPDSSRTVSIVLADSKEPAENTELVLVEAVDDIIPASSPSFTLRFMDDDEPARITRLWEADLVDRHGSLKDSVDKLFEVRDGAIAAVDPAAVFEALREQLAETVTLRVHAEDSAGRTHAGDVRFRVGLFNLAVTLAPPPSNPALPVSHVEVIVSVVGTASRIRRVADAGGRFEIASLPYATLAFDSETVVDGMYYYGQTTMTHSSDRSITLVMRHVSDVIKGVPALRVTVP